MLMIKRMSKAYQGDDDSDEDRVVYLDYDQSTEANHTNFESKDNHKAFSRDKKTIKFKPLFQQKKYRGDLEKERYIDNIDEVLWDGKQNTLPFDHDGGADGSQEDTTFVNHDSPFASTSGVSSAKKVQTPGSKRSFSAMTSLAESLVRPASVSPAAPRTSSSSSKPPPRATEVEPRDKDVGEDRPSHWNKMRANVPAKVQNKTATKSAKSAISNVRPVKAVQMPKPKALPSQPAPLSFGGNSRPSFRPSWLTSQSQSGLNSSQPTRTQRMGTPAAEERLLIETIQDVEERSPGPGSYSGTFRPPPRSKGHLSEDTHGAGHYDDHLSTSAELQNRHFVSRVSPQRSLTVHTLSSPAGGSELRFGLEDSGSKLPRGHSTHASRGGAAGTSKARPGSLKAKLQKVWRDADANENRIINIPVDSQSAKSRAMDLQDPRSRAVHYVDAQVVELLPDQAPFKVALLSVLGTWRKRGVDIAAEQVANGATVLGLFKPDTCVGHGRALEESAVMRVYEPQLWPLGNSVGAVATCRAEYVMINTNCWELVDVAN